MKKVLHAVFAIALACTMSLSSSAQMSDGSLVPNFQWTDIDGVTYDLYEMLDDNKIVVLDLFAVWCGPCWNYAQAGALDNLNDMYGEEGTDELRVFAIEADPSTAAGLITGGGNSIGDWTQQMSYSIANDDEMADILELAYYPTIYTIYPNRTIYESSQVSTAAHLAIAQAAQIASDDADAATVSYSGVKSVCGGDQEVTAFIQNMGLNTMTSATITVTGDLETEVMWTGSLDTYGFEEVVLGTINVDGNKSFTISTTTDGDVYAANNNASGSITQMDRVSGPNHIRVSIQCDNWPLETSWTLWSSSGEVLASVPFGTYSTANQYVQEDFFVADDECYMFEAIDAYGDGMYASQWGNFPDGGVMVTLVDENDNDVATIASVTGATNFDSLSGAAEIDQVVSVDEAELVSEFVIYPNPTNGNTKLMYTLTESSDVSVVVYNTLGSVVFNKDFGTASTGLNTFDLNFEGMDAGMYFVNLTANDRVVTKKVTLTK